MTDAIDCFWYPELAKCQVQEESAGGNGGSDAGSGGESAMATSSGSLVELPLMPMMGQSVYLLAALGQTTAGVFKLLRWREANNAGDDWYKAWTD